MERRQEGNAASPIKDGGPTVKVEAPGTTFDMCIVIKVKDRGTVHKSEQRYQEVPDLVKLENQAEQACDSLRGTHFALKLGDMILKQDNTREALREQHAAGESTCSLDVELPRIDMYIMIKTTVFGTEGAYISRGRYKKVPGLPELEDQVGADPTTVELVSKYSDHIFKLDGTPFTTQDQAREELLKFHASHCDVCDGVSSSSCMLTLELRSAGPPRPLRQPLHVRIHVEGNIGSGKTSLMEYLEERSRSPHSVYLVREPIDKWKPFLDDFYRQLEKERPGIGMPRSEPASPETLKAVRALDEEIWAYYEEISTTQFDAPIIVERSPKSKVEVFSAMRKEMGLVEPHVYEELRRKYHELEREPSYRPTVVLYCDIPVAEAYDRILARGRPFEMNMDKGYLGAVDRKYKEVFQPGRAEHVLVLNSMEPVDEEVSRVCPSICRAMRDQGCDLEQVRAVENFLTHRQLPSST